MIRSYAKINLDLWVGPPRESDGYHPIKSVFQTIDLYDELSISKQADKGLSLICDLESIPLDETNTISKAHQAIAHQIDFGLEIQLKKTIPTGAGLGGGSSNAAALLGVLFKNGDLRCSNKELLEIALSIGADVPYFLSGGTAHVSGIGEVIEPMNTDNSGIYLLINPGIHCNTKEIYTAFDERKEFRVKEKNSLKPIVFQRHKELGDFEEWIRSENGPDLEMTGSGSTLFMSFETNEKAKKWQKQINQKLPAWSTWVCASVNQGWEVV